MSTLNYLLFSSKEFLLSIILSFPTAPEKKTGLLLTNTKTSSVQKKKKMSQRHSVEKQQKFLPFAKCLFVDFRAMSVIHIM